MHWTFFDDNPRGKLASSLQQQFSGAVCQASDMSYDGLPRDHRKKLKITITTAQPQNYSLRSDAFEDRSGYQPHLGQTLEVEPVLVILVRGADYIVCISGLFVVNKPATTHSSINCNTRYDLMTAYPTHWGLHQALYLRDFVCMAA